LQLHTRFFGMLSFAEVIQRSGFQSVAVDQAAALRVRALPWHHRDPFDRLLIAQALEEGFTIVTRDALFSADGVSALAA
jgi:PIN domain nuclease of toxin-antitoxin system